MGRPLSFFSEAFQVVAVVLRHITTSFITTQRRTFTMLRRHMTFNNNEAALTSASKVLVRVPLLVLVLCAMEPVAASSRQVLFGIDAGPDPTDVPSPTDAAPTASAPTTSAPTTSAPTSTPTSAPTAACVDAATTVTYSKHTIFNPFNPSNPLQMESFAEGARCDVKDCVEVGDISMIMNKEDCQAAATAMGSDYMFQFFSASVEAADAPFGCWAVEYNMPVLNGKKAVFWNSGTKDTAIVSLDGGGCVEMPTNNPTCKYSKDSPGDANYVSPQPIYPVCAHHTQP